MHWWCSSCKTVVAYEKEAKPKQKRITNKEYDEAFDAWSILLFEQYRKQKQVESITQTETNEEY